MSSEIVTTGGEDKGAITLTNGRMQPANHAQVWRLADVLVKSGMVPQGLGTTEKMFLAMSKALMLGLDWTQVPDCMMVVNNRPSIWGDVPKGLVMRSGLCADFSETFDEATMTATCTTTRWGRSPDGASYKMTPHVSTFSQKDAMTAGLWGKPGPWKTNPKRMLQLRARAFNLRDSFPDVLGGLPIAEEFFGVEPASHTRTMVENVAGGTKPVPAIPEPTAPPRVDPFKPEPVVVVEQDSPSMTEDEAAELAAAMDKQPIPDLIPMGGKQTIGTNTVRRGKSPAL